MRKEPEARAIVIGAIVTIGYVDHATLPLRAWRVADSLTYPIGFPLAASFMTCSILVILSIVWYLRMYPTLLEHSFGDTANKDGAVMKVELLEIKAR